MLIHDGPSPRIALIFKEKTKTRQSSRLSNPAAERRSPAIKSPGGDSSEKPWSESLAFPIVGVGASAGGLEAFTQLLNNLPTDTGMAFVLVQHLDPAHESALTSLLTRASAMPVQEVTNNLPVKANHIYVIPPNASMTVVRGVLKLSAREGHGMHRSIDFFFKSLAQDQNHPAIGVILSGTATDGTLGLEAIKEQGGIAFAQDESAKYDSMPRSAVTAGCVDFVLSPERIAQELARIARHPYVVSHHLIRGEAERESAMEGDRKTTTLPSGGRGTPATGAHRVRAEAESSRVPRWEESSFKSILLLLRNHSDVDFSLYKPSTLHRRVARRVVLNKRSSLDEYAAFLKGNTKELDSLYADVLISVTSFFRNPEAFDALKRKVFPKLLHQRRDDPVRVWVLGCSTGQEAYSIAMSFAEFCENMPRVPKLQIFATDLNETLLDKARHGLYTKTLAQDISPERLRRFFVEEDAGYRVSKSIREQVVFARQNLMNDPPFSRMDLISCRNVLIYLEPSLQKRIIPTFHYALKPDRFLFMGASEAVGQFTDLFEPIDKKQKIFAKKPGVNQPFNLSRTKGHVTPPSSGIRQPGRLTRGQDLPEELRGEVGAQREADRLAICRFSPPGVLINAELKILQFRGSTTTYLEPPTGKASFDVLKMAREGLRMPLRAAINNVKKEGKPVRREDIRIEANGRPRRMNFEVIPLKNLKERFYLILFELAQARNEKLVLPNAPQPKPLGKRQESRRIARLELELAETRDYLQSIQEQSEASNEELHASNEEVQSTNEELQSINEELETSKEELESANEELTTLNEEMANRNAELNRLNADLTNLQTSIKLPILLLGSDLTIRRFSAPAKRLFNLHSTDIGRPLNAVRHNLLEPEGPNEPFPLEQVVRRVIDTMHEQEREACDSEGHWYSLHVRPYMTVDNKVDGAVFLMIDITSLKLIERQVIFARDYAEATIRTTRDPLIILSADLKVERANDAFYKTFKVTPQETENTLIYQLDGRQWNIPKLRELLEGIIPRNSFFNDFEVTHDFQHIGRRTMLLNARRIASLAGLPEKILLGIQDITEKIHLDEEVRRSEDRFRSLVLATTQVVWTTNADGLVEQDSPTWRVFTGQTLDQRKGWGWLDAIHPDDRQPTRVTWLESVANKRIWETEYRLRAVDGSYRWTAVRAVPVLNADGGIREWIGANTDITERKRSEDALRESEGRYRTLFDLGPVAVYSIDAAGVIQDFNRRAVELWGRRPVPGDTDERFCGSFKMFRPDGSFMPHDQCPMAEVVSGKISAAHDAEVIIERPDGSRVTVLVNIHPLRNNRGEVTGAINCFYDITQIKRDEEALRESKALLADRALQLEQLVAERTAALQDTVGDLEHFSYTITHDMRAPLRALQGFGNELLDRAAAEQTQEKAFLKRLVAAAKRMDALIQDSLQYAKAIREKPSLAPVEPGPVLRGVLESYPALQAPNVDLQVVEPLPPVMANEAGLAQCFSNLLSNAIKFTKPGNVPQVRVWAETLGNLVRLWFEDNGIGIPTEYRERIFDMFQQLDKSYEGTGIGLALVHKTAQRMGGKVGVESEVGKGSRFWLELKRAEP